jgi:glycosyltransferase involved in cell wall biosynthesis
LISEKKINFIVPWYGSIGGGTGTLTKSYAEALNQRGFDVEVLTTTCVNPYESWWNDSLSPGSETIDGISVKRFPVNKANDTRYHEINLKLISGKPITKNDQRQMVINSINSDQLVNYVCSSCLDQINIGLPYTQGLIYSMIKKSRGGTLIPCLHDEAQARWITTSEMLFKARHILFLTEEEKDLAILLFGRTIGRKIVESHVIGIGTDLFPTIVRNDYSQVSRQQNFAKIFQACKREYNLPEKYILYVGRKEEAKNIILLKKYFRIYHNKRPDINLVFVGSGNESLVATEGGIIDLGWIPEYQKSGVLFGAIALVNLSENESFSQVLSESWACGTPVVVSAGCRVTRARCERSKGGIPVANYIQFEQAINSLENKQFRAKMGDRGCKYLFAEYSWDNVIERFIRGVDQ